MPRRSGRPRRRSGTITKPEWTERYGYEIEEGKGGVTKLTVTHDLEGAPKLAALVRGEMEPMGAGGGWSWVLSDLKTLLETGHRLEG